MAYQSMGILLIGITPVLRDGVTLAAFFGLLGFTFAGFTFPIEQMPYVTQIFSHLFPIRFYFKIYVNQALNGLSIGYSVHYLVALLVFTISLLCSTPSTVTIFHNRAVFPICACCVVDIVPTGVPSATNANENIYP